MRPIAHSALCLLTELLALACLVGPAGPVRADEAPAKDAFRETEDQMALLLDRTRASAGLLALARTPALDGAAVAHAQDMVARGYMDHDAPDGSTPASRAADNGYQTPPGGAWLVVEVISARGDPPDAAVNWWLGDGLHRRVVLRPTWREMGIGFAPGGPYGRFWVVLFGCRPNVLPPVLLDGLLTIPNETCGAGGDAFGQVQSIRAAESPERARALDWQAYEPLRPWPAGRPAHVQLRDDAGRVLEAVGTDPTGTP
jgi:hypothetical protein